MRWEAKKVNDGDAPSESLNIHLNNHHEISGFFMTFCQNINYSELCSFFFLLYMQCIYLIMYIIFMTFCLNINYIVNFALSLFYCICNVYTLLNCFKRSISATREIPINIFSLVIEKAKFYIPD